LPDEIVLIGHLDFWPGLAVGGAIAGSDIVEAGI
jgi:hypothetical protein